MVKPARFTWAEHLRNVFLTYPRYATAWTFNNFTFRLEQFGRWLINEPSLFIASVFVLIHSGLALLFYLRAIYYVLARIIGIKATYMNTFYF